MHANENQIRCQLEDICDNLAKKIDNYCKKFIYDQNKLKRKIHQNYYTYPLGHIE